MSIQLLSNLNYPIGNVINQELQRTNSVQIAVAFFEVFRCESSMFSFPESIFILTKGKSIFRGCCLVGRQKNLNLNQNFLDKGSITIIK